MSEHTSSLVLDFLACTATVTVIVICNMSTAAAGGNRLPYFTIDHILLCVSVCVCANLFPCGTVRTHEENEQRLNK